MIEIDGRVAGAARRIDVHDLQIFADRARLQSVFPGHGHGRDAHVEHRGIRLLPRIVRVDPEAAEWRLGNRRVEGKRDEMSIHRFRGWRWWGFRRPWLSRYARHNPSRLKGRAKRTWRGHLSRGCLDEFRSRQVIFAPVEAGLRRDLCWLRDRASMLSTGRQPRTQARRRQAAISETLNLAPSGGVWVSCEAGAAACESASAARSMPVPSSGAKAAAPLPALSNKALRTASTRIQSSR